MLLLAADATVTICHSKTENLAEIARQADILVAGHHGSKYATSQELLDAVKPELALISVGANNSYGHPTQEVLDRLTGANCTIRRTELEGTIVIRRNSRGEKTGS